MCELTFWKPPILSFLAVSMLHLHVQLMKRTFGGLWKKLVILIKNRFSIMIDWSIFKNRFFDPIINFWSYTKAVQKVRSHIFCLSFKATLKQTTKRRMFRRFVRPYCKNLKTLCMFLIVLQSSKSGVASSWYRQIWNVCGDTFFTS